jgi:multiple sugar transport system permease protein
MTRNRMSSIFLILVACLICYPLIFLFIGSLMGSDELKNNLSAVLESGTTEFITWSVLPLYPTLQSYVKLLLDTPEFFVMFWNSVRISFGVLLGQFLIATPCAWGFAQGKFKRKSNYFFIHHFDAAAISGFDAAGVFDAEKSQLTRYIGCGYSAQYF